MKRIFAALIFLGCMAFPIHAQTSGNTPPPPPYCTSANAGALYTNTGTSPATVYTCSYYNLAWQWVVNPSYGGLVSYPTVPTTCSGSLPVFLAGWPNTQEYVCVNGVPDPIGGAGSGVGTFSAPSGSWPSWLVPTVTNPTTTPSLAVAAGIVPPANGGTGSSTAAGANLNITGVTQTGTLGTSSQVSTFPGTLAAGATLSSTGPIVDARAVGIKCDGTTDDTAALNAADAALATAGGGTLRFPVGICVIAGHVVLPNNNTAVPSYPHSDPYSQQAPIHWLGTSPDLRNGQRRVPFSASAPWTGTMLKMIYGGNGVTGPLAESFVDAGGSGYAVGDTGTLGGTCSGTTYTVEVVDTGSYTVGRALSTLTHTGYVEQVYISNKGTSCTVAENVATSTGGAQPGSGTGLTINIAAVTGGSFAKIETYGMGYFEMDHFTLYDSGSDTLPFLRSTGTTLNIHDNLFWGTGFVQDALVLGGTSDYFVTLNSPLAAWQGYDSKIENNNFSKIRRATLTQMYSAATMVDHNYIDGNSGSDMPEGGAFESINPWIDSVNGTRNSGNGGENFYSENRVEMRNYPYAFKFFQSNSNSIDKTDIEDVGTGGYVNANAVISYTGNSINTIALVHVASTLPPVITDSNSLPLTNTLISSLDAYSSKFPNGVTVGGGYGTPNNMFTASAEDSPFGDLNAAWGVVTPATSTTNHANPYGWESVATYWNGTASSNDKWYWAHLFSPTNGTNPASTYRLYHSGSSGTVTLDLSQSALALPGATVISGGIWTFSNGNNFSGNNLFGAYQVIRNTTAATSGSNPSSPCWYYYNYYWNGTASTLNQWCQYVTFGTGTNPTTTMNLYVTGGTPGIASVQVPNLISLGTINVAAARKGTFTCAAGGTITVSNTLEAATSDVIISLNTAGGTISTAPAMKTVTSGTGFTVLCGTLDTSVYNYDILN